MTVLIVDEDLTARQACAADLRGEGCDVLEAESAESALELMRARHPEAVITDYPMPLRGGGTFAAAVRLDPALSETLIIAYASWAWRRTRVHAMANGCDAFFGRPTPAGRLLREIRDVLRRDGLRHVGAGAGDAGAVSAAGTG